MGAGLFTFWESWSRRRGMRSGVLRPDQRDEQPAGRCRQSAHEDERTQTNPRVLFSSTRALMLDVCPIDMSLRADRIPVLKGIYVNGPVWAENRPHRSRVSLNHLFRSPITGETEEFRENGAGKKRGDT